MGVWQPGNPESGNPKLDSTENRSVGGPVHESERVDRIRQGRPRLLLREVRRPSACYQNRLSRNR
jgi:hypothetical protein